MSAQSEASLTPSQREFLRKIRRAKGGKMTRSAIRQISHRLMRNTAIVERSDGRRDDLRQHVPDVSLKCQKWRIPPNVPVELLTNAEPYAVNDHFEPYIHVIVQPIARGGH